MARALLVMDFQPGVLQLLDDDGAAVVAHAAEAIAIARGRGDLVAYVRVAFSSEDIAAFPETARMAERVRAGGDMLRHDSPLTAIDERLAPHRGDIVVRKTRVGAFSTTDLDEQLRSRGVDTLLLAGVSTSGVVLSTVRDAHDRDYHVIVLADACADPDPEVHRVLLEKVFPRQADVIDVAAMR